MASTAILKYGPYILIAHGTTKGGLQKKVFFFVPLPNDDNDGDDDGDVNGDDDCL